MDRHGIGAPFNWQRTGRRAGPAKKGAPHEQEELEAIARTLRMRGFRHFLKEPTPEQRFRIYGASFRTRAKRTSASCAC